MQALGGTYTIISEEGYMARLDAKDADILGIDSAPGAQGAATPAEFSENQVWEQLRTVYDPEIPVNVVDLGLIYDCKIAPLQEEKEQGNQIDIKMTMTAPGCGMADVLKMDIERKLGGLPSVKQVNVEVVFDPPWNPTRMSEAARLQLGLDLDSSYSPMYGR
jgi:probable FeS assembly SUF system protein SufT